MTEGRALNEAFRRGRASIDPGETPAISLADLLPFCRLVALAAAFERGRAARRAVACTTRRRAAA